MQQYYLAIDIGASGGRHILGSIVGGRIQLEEVYRFQNRMEMKNGHLCWNLPRIFEEIKKGLKKCKETGKIPVSVGIDTWAVDFVLLDKNNEVLGDSIGYRDSRTSGMDQLVNDKISAEELYRRTGIQKQIFNSIYQLMAMKQRTPLLMEQAEGFLMLPDYFNFLLTGTKLSEYTNATTTQLVNVQTKTWDYELIDLLGYQKEMFQPLSMPKTVVGNFTKEMEDEIGFQCQVVLPATHDTGSAVLSVPAKEDFIYISSGTWSLIGIERMTADCSDISRVHNFTNEGGYEYRYRYLKNIMGLWMIQCVRYELGNAYSYEELCELAALAEDFPSRVDVNDACFLAPLKMTEAIKLYCRRTNQPEPVTAGEIAACIYQSLAESYAAAVKEIEAVTGKCYSRINVIGGGSSAGYLNKLTAKATGKEVYAGPMEATAIGNILVQMLKTGEFNTTEEARDCVYHSFPINKFIKA